MRMILAKNLSVAFVVLFSFGLLPHITYAEEFCEQELKKYSRLSSSQLQFEAGEALMEANCSDASVELWNRAAEAQHAEALFRLGVIYQGGDGGIGHIRSDSQKAFPYFVKAAELGNADAMYMLGMHYEFGTTFLRKDSDIAWKWYLKAAEGKNKPAIERVVLAYEKGQLRQVVSEEQMQFWKSKL